ncbi:MAG: GAF domain-containing protein [Chloroflexota bacterium]
MKESSRVLHLIKEAAHITGADWGAHLERQGGKWHFLHVYRINKKRVVALGEYLSRASVDSWLCGALGSRSSRSRSILDESVLGCPRLYAYPVGKSTDVLLVGGGEQDKTSRAVWKLAADALSDGAAQEPEVLPVVSDTLVPSIQEGVPYDLPAALDRILALIAQQIPCQGAWLGVRRGDIFDLRSHWRAPQCKNISLAMEAYDALREIGLTHAGLRFERDQPGWEFIPQMGLKPTTGAWGCVPLVVGRRLIGAVALWRLRTFNDQEWKQFLELVARAAPSVEIILTFTELSGHLRRLALLNDFVLTVSSGQNLDQIARRAFALVARAFQTESISMYLLSTDGRMLREYQNDSGRLSIHTSSVAGHPFASVLKIGHIQSFDKDSAPVDLQFALDESHTLMLVPLKYRGRNNGLLVLGQERSDEFSVYDIHSLTVLSGYLAGLVEYSRLREEAEARARNLGLIHEVVQEVIGLVNKQEVVQITAELLVQYFGYEFAVIVLVDRDGNATICGVGGSQAPSAQAILSEILLSAREGDGGITGYVLRTGESILVNDVSRSPLYYPLRGWEAGSELCIALKEGNRVIGLMDIESSVQNAFGQNDFMALESLAGILSSVLSSADQYQRLQENILQLQQIQLELQTRIEAQMEAERRLIQAEKLAAVGEMAAGIAHELNNPLTTVTGFTELALEEMPLEAANRSDLEMVLKEARRARDVVRRLLDFSRRSESERTRVDINQLVNDALSLTKHLIHTSGVQLDLRLGTNLPWVSVDRNQIKQVFLNLFHNALQAMPSGGSLKVESCFRERDERKWVVASVADTGGGIAVADKERIFEPFFTTRSGQGGTGLGLSVTYGIVSDHGGMIEVESELGQGACFTVWLPF